GETVLRCDVVRQPDGSVVVVTLIDIDQNIRGGMIASATHFRNDGSVVSVAGYNYDPSGHGRIVMQPSIPVTNAQLLVLATEPAPPGGRAVAHDKSRPGHSRAGRPGAAG